MYVSKLIPKYWAETFRVPLRVSEFTMSDGKTLTSRWADEIDDDDFIVVPTTHEKEKPRKDRAQKDRFQEPPVSKDGERIKTVAEIITDPDTGKKSKITRTFRIERKLG